MDNSKVMHGVNRVNVLSSHLVWKELPFSLYTTIHESDYDFSHCHSHDDFWELVIVRAGRAVHNRQNDAVVIRSGDVFVITPGELHYFTEASGLDICNLLFSSEFIKSVPGAEKLLPEFWWKPLDRVRSLGNADFFTLLSLLDEIASEQEKRSAESQAIVIADAVKIFALLMRNSSTGPETGNSGNAMLRISELVKTLKVRYNEHWNLERMARYTGYSTASFRRYFKEFVKVSPGEFLLSMRLEKAAMLLINTHCPVSAAAEDCGFSDASYFARQFRKKFGCTPLDFRMEYKRGQML